MSTLFRKTFISHQSEDDTVEVLPEPTVRYFLPVSATFLFIILSIVAWLFLAKIDVHVKSQGMVFPIGGVRESISLGTGRVTYIHKTGAIEVGDSLVELVDPINQKKYRSEVLIFQNMMINFQIEKEKLEENYRANKSLIEKQSQISLDKVESLKALLQDMITFSEKYREVAEKSISEQKEDMKIILETYKGYMDKLKALKLKGYASDKNIIPIIDKYESIAQAVSKLTQDLPQAQLNFVKESKQINTLRDQINNELIAYQTLSNKLEQNEIDRRLAISKLEVKRRQESEKLVNLEYRNWLENNLFSEYDADLITLKKRVGQIVEKGEAVALLGMKPQQEKQMLLISPRAKNVSLTLTLDGEAHKLVAKGETLADIMSTISEQLKSIASIKEVSIKKNRLIFLFDGTQIYLSNSELSDETNVPVFSSLSLVGENRESNDLINMAILRYEDAKLVQVGSEALVKPLFERALIGASLKSTVMSVSPYALTRLQSYSLIGNSDLSSKIMKDAPGEIVLLKFNRLPSGEYDWGDRTPLRPISSGVPTTSLIVVDTVAPIEIILPFVARIFGSR